MAIEACVPLPAVLPWLHRHATALRLVPPPAINELPGGIASEDMLLQRLWACCGPLMLDLEGQQWDDKEQVCPHPSFPAPAVHSKGSMHTCLQACGSDNTPLLLLQLAAAILEYADYIEQLATAGGHRHTFAFRSSLFVPQSTVYSYSGHYEPVPMLRLQDMQQLQVGYRAWRSMQLSAAACPFVGPTLPFKKKAGPGWCWLAAASAPFELWF